MRSVLSFAVSETAEEDSGFAGCVGLEMADFRAFSKSAGTDMNRSPVHVDLQKGNSIYGASTTVQPAALRALILMRAY